MRRSDASDEVHSEVFGTAAEFETSLGVGPPTFEPNKYVVAAVRALAVPPDTKLALQVYDAGGTHRWRVVLDDRRTGAP